MVYTIMTAYNEEAALATLLPLVPRRVDGHDMKIIVVDDGSTDATAAVAASHGCSVVRSETNQGKGASLRLGIAQLRDRTFDGVIFMDADGQHDPAHIPQLIKPILDDTADMVVGSRYIASGARGKTPWNRYLVRSVTVVVLNRILGTDITDPYSGYRVMNPSMLACLELTGDRYESELEMLFCANRADMRVVERPIRKIYNGATSKMSARRGRILGRVEVVWGYAKTIVRGVLRTQATDTSPDLELIAS